MEREDKHSQANNLTLSRLAAGTVIMRKPYGRRCTVEKFNPEKTKVLVRDGQRSVWVNTSTIQKDWVLNSKT